jgi:scyllo-inositol 2-dehydrogenase (NADP+)
MKKVINTALASYGMSGEVFHAPALLCNPNFTITKVLERSKDKSKDKIPSAQIVRDYDDILNDKSIDLVVVNTPNHLHFSMAKAALQHGKHVVLEKPITNTVAEAEELIALAKNKGLILAPYHNRRLESGHKTVKEVLDKKLLGNIKLFETRIDRWRPGIGPKKWKEEPNPGAGLFYDLGPHLIDEALVFFGKPKTISADLRIQREGGMVDDYFHIILEFDGVKAELKSGLIAREAAPWYTVHGDQGSFIKYGLDPQEKLLMRGALPNSKEWGMESEDSWGILHNDSGRHKYPSLPGAYQYFYENLAEVISKGKKLLIQPEEAREVIRLIEFSQRSNQEKRTITL